MNFFAIARILCVEKLWIFAERFPHFAADVVLEARVQFGGDFFDISVRVELHGVFRATVLHEQLVRLYAERVGNPLDDIRRRKALFLFHAVYVVVTFVDAERQVVLR